MKNLYDLFDTVDARELDLLLSDNIQFPLPADATLHSLKQKVYQKTGLRATKKSSLSLFHRRAIPLAACLLLLIIAVLGTAAYLRAKQNTPAANDVEYVIYLGSSDLSALTKEEEAGINQVSKELTVPRKALPENCDFNFMIIGEFENESAPKVKAFSIGGNDYQLEYRFSQSNSLANSKNASLQKYGSYDRYATSGYIVDFMQESGQLLSYFDSTAANKAGGNFTEAEAQAAADQLLTALYGNECLEYYADTPSKCSSYDNTIVVTYTKYIGGYPTSDTLQLRFNRHGELWGLNANTYGLMKSIVDQYTSVQLQAAEKVLTDYFKIISYTASGGATFRVNSEGECYLELYGSSPSGMKAFYINVD